MWEVKELCRFIDEEETKFAGGKQVGFEQELAFIFGISQVLLRHGWGLQGLCQGTVPLLLRPCQGIVPSLLL